jgi:hypothetical protein
MSSLRHVKEPYRYEKRYLVGKIQPFLAKFLLLLYQVYLLVFARKLWCMNQE